MASYKLVFLLAMAGAITLVFDVLPSSGFEFFKTKKVSSDFILGSRLSGDRLILQKTIYRTAKSWKSISLRVSFNASKHVRITQVVAYDQKRNGKAAVVKLFKGGPGKQNITLKFKSRRGHGINYIVKVYGR
ncbi:probable salivary secreted peptide [Belonocnema kinseyi]|uniref:probable salivary secreted peptide n=1 Tax=Belonocnema kinseyi TaxID=2817044 RepID=UPI00143D8596|nr:probable salivary secreted peptide [Belonocnema kinseyi]